jgi:hypothetical protein
MCLEGRLVKAAPSDLAGASENLMNAQEFRHQVEWKGGDLAEYIDQVAQAADPYQDSIHGAAPSQMFGVAAYGVFQVAKSYFENKRGLRETELHELMLDQVAALVCEKWPTDDALATVQAVSKNVSRLHPDSPALKAALTLLRCGETRSN